MATAGAPSWDVMILNFDGHTPIPVASFRPGHGPRPMGPAGSVRADIDAALDGIDWTDPGHGVLDAGEPRFAIDIGREGMIEGFVVRVSRPAGAASLIAHMCLVNGWVALDCGSGAYLDLEAPERWTSGSPAGEA